MGKRYVEAALHTATDAADEGVTLDVRSPGKGVFDAVSFFVTCAVGTFAAAVEVSNNNTDWFDTSVTLSEADDATCVLGSTWGAKYIRANVSAVSDGVSIYAVAWEA
jgi:hypothetical protein